MANSIYLLILFDSGLITFGKCCPVFHLYTFSFNPQMLVQLEKAVFNLIAATII